MKLPAHSSRRPWADLPKVGPMRDRGAPGLPRAMEVFTAHLTGPN
jgi:hypothetical protein